jgi:NADH:ubiquinone oxidoreductase subunit 2 (subunit N)
MSKTSFLLGFLLVASAISFFFYLRVIIILSLFNNITKKETYFLASDKILNLALTANILFLIVLWVIS